MRRASPRRSNMLKIGIGQVLPAPGSKKQANELLFLLAYKTSGDSHLVQKIRDARTRLDDISKIAATSQSEETRCTARLMRDVTVDLWFDLIDLYRDVEGDDDAMRLLSYGLCAGLEGSR